MKNIFRFGLCADTHGKPFPKFDSPRLVIHAGDMYDFGRLPSAEHAVAIVEAVKATPTLFVKGNHDTNDSYKIMKAGDITGQVCQFVPRREARPALWFVGIGMGCGTEDGGIGLPSEGHLAKVCGEVLNQAVAKMQDGDQCILVSHYPALVPEVMPFLKGYGTEGFFFNCVRKVCEALRPLLAIQGHAHSMNGRTIESDGITYVWPGPAGMILEVGLKDDDSAFEVQVQKCPRTRAKKAKDEGPQLF